MPCPNPLKPEDCTTINRLLQSINETLELAAKCKACQLPVEEDEAANMHQKAVLEAVKRNFFPNNP